MIACDHCSSTFTERKSLLRHERSKHKNIKFNCAHCEYSCTRKDSLTRHIQTQHVGTLKRKSEPEPEKTKRKRYCENYEVFYSDDEKDDDIPNLPDQVEDKLEDMMEEIDLQQLMNLTDSDLQRILELDPEDSRTNKQLEPEKEKLTGKGTEKKKDESNVFKCNDCDSTFTLKQNLYRHIRNHHEHNHLCKKCGKFSLKKQ